MPNVTIEIGTRKYALTCKDGGEARLTQLAANVDEKATQLIKQLGAINESQLLVMVALMLADERDAALHSPVKTAPVPPRIPEPDPAVLNALAGLAERAEALVERLERPNPRA